MRINDILMETQSNEGFASGVGNVARGIASVPGAIHGVWDAAKQGYQQGRAAVGGVSPENQKLQKAAKFRQQADAIDGGNSAQFFATPHQGVPGFKPPKIKVKPQAAGGQGQPFVAPTTNNTQQPAAAVNPPVSSAATNNTQQPPENNTAGAGAFSNMANTVAGPNTMANTPVSATNVSNNTKAAKTTANTPPANPQSALLALGARNRQTPAPGTINGLRAFGTNESKRFKFRSSFLNMDI